MSDNFAWVQICILDGGHFSFLDAGANPRTNGHALTPPNHMQTALFYQLWTPQP